MGAFLRRQRREVELALPAPSVAAAVMAVRMVPRRYAWNTAKTCRPRVRDDGRVTCRKLPQGREVPAYFRGRLYDTGTGVVLRGRVWESWGEIFTTGMFTVAALGLLAVAVADVAGPRNWSAALWMCLLAALMAVFAFALGALRPRGFDGDVNRVTTGLAALFSHVDSGEPVRR